ncbi:MAG: RICIN domain-containing protein [bacterium]
MKKKVLAWLLSTAVIFTPLTQTGAYASSVESVGERTESSAEDRYNEDGFLGEEDFFLNETDSGIVGEQDSSDHLLGEEDVDFEESTQRPDSSASDQPEENPGDISGDIGYGEDEENPGDISGDIGYGEDEENPDGSTVEDSAPEDPTDSTQSSNKAPGQEGNPAEENPEGISDASDVSDPEVTDEEESATDEKEAEKAEEEPEIIDEEGEAEEEEAVAGLSENKELYRPKNGTYIFDTTLDGNNLLSIKNATPGADLAEGAKAVVSANATDLNVYWQLTKNEDNTYRIISFESGLALTASGTEVVQKAYTGADEQKWYIRRFGTKTFTSFTPKSNTKMRLALAGSTDKFAAAGSKIILAKAGATHQMWYLKSRTSPQVSLKDGDYYLYPGTKSGKAAYVQSNSKQEDAPVVLYSWLGRRGQWFRVKSLGKGNLYTITNIYSKMALYPKKGAKKDGTPIVQHTADDSLDQAWRLVEKEGQYQLIHAASGLALGLTDGSYAGGTELDLETPNNKATQKWTFVEIDTVGKDTQGEDAKLASGYYRLTTAADTSLVASVSGKRESVGTKLTLLEKDAKERATFYIKALSNGKYAIRSFFSMKYVGVNYDVAENNYKLETKKDYSAASSKWYIRKSAKEDGKLSIVNAANTAMVLTFEGDAKSGAVLKISLSTGEKAQRWSASKMVNQKPLTDGERYVLGSLLNTGFVISTENTYAGTGSAILRSSEKQPWEVYVFEYVGPSNIYRIRNQWSWKVLSGASGENEDVSLVDDKDAENQLWHVRAMGSAKYSISNVKTGKLLTVKDGSAASGTGVVVSEDAGKAAQIWVMHKATSIEKVPTNINLLISPKGTNNVLEVKDGSMVERTPIQFNVPSESAKQVFEIIPSGNYYKLRNVATGKYLTSTSAKATSRASISGKAQLWKVYPSGIRYYFKNVGNGGYLSTDDPAFSAGTQLILSKTKMVSRLTYTIVSGWQYVGGGLKYINDDGSYTKNSFLNYNGNLVYVGSDGSVQTGWIKYGAYYYYFNGSAGQVRSDARAYISQLYPGRRAGHSKPAQTGPDCNYRITVDRQSPCQVTVYTQYPGQSEYNVPVVSYLCSPGADGTPTAAGERVAIHADRWQLLMGPSYGQYGMAILLRDSNNEWYANGDYFHSLACGSPNDHNLDPGSYNLLGNRASHGCVRLNVRNAYWQYNFMASYTSVYVGDNLVRPLNALPQPYASGAVDPTDPAYTGNYGYTENGVYFNPAGFH